MRNGRRRRGGWRLALDEGTGGLVWLVAAAALLLGAGCANLGDEGPGISPADDEDVGVARGGLTANIAGAIQIDGPPNGADLYADAGVPLNAGAMLDWVLDSAPNAGVGCLGADGVATCVEPGVTGAVGGTGHWNGARIVDGIAGDDQDIFLTGGKENDFETWNIGPGSVGSSKYDIVQAYLANNQTTLFFGMERRGNNGTTFFDFEFNQASPTSCATPPDVPCRTVGDVLFGFEMQGSGGSGSATPFVFTWNGTAFVPSSAAGLLASINTSTTTAGGPWGHVDSRGDWVLGDLARHQLGEASAPLSLLPGVDVCGGEAWVQVRTRSSDSATSDLKDTTKIFRFEFLNLTASATLTGSCDGSLGLSAGATDPDGAPIPVGQLTCAWDINDGAYTSSNCVDTLTGLPAGTYSGTVTVSASGIPGCTDDADSNTVAVYTPITVTIAPDGLSLMCDGIETSGDDVTYTASVAGGSGNYSYSWSGCTSTSSSCTVDPPDGDFCVAQDVQVTVSDDSGICPSTPSEIESYLKVTVVTSTNN